MLHGVMAYEDIYASVVANTGTVASGNSILKDWTGLDWHGSIKQHIDLKATDSMHKKPQPHSTAQHMTDCIALKLEA
jgi:hypothetical protein